MACPEIKNLRLSPQGQEALRDIKRVRGLADALAVALGAGTVVSIFAGNGALQSSYNIRDTEWKTWSQAMASIDDILRKKIRDIAFQQSQIILFGDEHKFWSAIVDGCGK